MENQQPGGAAGPQTGRYSHVPVKEENSSEPTDGRLHHFKKKFRCKVHKKSDVDCEPRWTVLEGIVIVFNFLCTITKKYNELKRSDENLVIQPGAQHGEVTIATNFPCSCIDDEESRKISHKSEAVEIQVKPSTNTEIHSRDQYSVFYTDAVGGTNAKTKKLFKNNAVEKFDCRCVYGEKGTTVEEQRDGRFSDDLCNYTLSCQGKMFERTQKVDKLYGKEFNINLPQDKTVKDKKQQENPRPSEDSQYQRNTRSVLEVAYQNGISVRVALEISDDPEKIYELQHQLLSARKEQMQKRFPDDFHQKVLELRKENSWNGKIQQLFSDMHRLRKLLKLSESVCKVIVKNVIKGTGFVLFGNYILTNAHLFKDYVEGETLERGVEVSVDFYFNYDDTISHRHQVVKSYICPEGDLDYAVLEFNTEDQRVSNLKTQTQQNIKIPPGLLKDFGPVPPSGEAYLIGHPGGEVKKMDPTYIIEKEKRKQAVDDYLHPYKDSPFTLQSISQLIREQDIENIMTDGKLAEKVVTYNTFMYHGSSGSPVFDAQCKVFGLHTRGYVYGFPQHEESVIEYAFSLHTVLKHFMNMLKTKGPEELLKSFEEAAEGNSDLQEVLKSVSEAQVVKAEPADAGNLSDSSEPMDTD